MNTTIRPAGGLCLPDKCRVTLLALGDVGSTLLMGLPTSSVTCAPAYRSAGSSS